MKFLNLMILIIFLMSPFHSYGQASPTNPPPSYDDAKIISELKKVKDELVTTNKKVSALMSKAEIKINNKESVGDISAASLLAALVILLAASITGFVALRVQKKQSDVLLKNQQKQSEENQLLKSIEIIMSSANGYQAGKRVHNLDAFLDDNARSSFKGIDNNFSGLEYTALSVSLAQAMSEKAKSPEEVLKIWQSIVDQKHAIQSVKYPEI